MHACKVNEKRNRENDTKKKIIRVPHQVKNTQRGRDSDRSTYKLCFVCKNGDENLAFFFALRLAVKIQWRYCCFYWYWKKMVSIAFLEMDSYQF